LRSGWGQEWSFCLASGKGSGQHTWFSLLLLLLLLLLLCVCLHATAQPCIFTLWMLLLALASHTAELHGVSVLVVGWLEVRGRRQVVQEAEALGHVVLGHAQLDGGRGLQLREVGQVGDVGEGWQACCVCRCRLTMLLVLQLAGDQVG
jgi:hypothetical protein